MTIKERIVLALARSNKSQRDLAKFMGLSSPTVSSMLSKDEIDSIKYLKAVEDITGFRFEWLRTGEGPDKTTEDNEGYDLNETYWKDKLKTKDELIEELRRRIHDLLNYKMSFCEELEANNIDPDKFISFQKESIAYSRKLQESDSGSMNYRSYLETDQVLTLIEKFINRLERERLQQKMRDANEKQISE